MALTEANEGLKDILSSCIGLLVNYSN